MDNFQIETAQNVRIAQNVAGVGDRILAYLIDGILILGYIVLSSFVLSQVDALGGGWALTLIIGLPPFLYFLLWESFWNGQSPGKAAMYLRVVKLDGSKAGFSDYLIRWILRLIDITIASGSVAVVCILINGKGQRLGDLAAGTTVISEKKPIGLSENLWIDLPQTYRPKYPQVRILTDSDMQGIRKLYQEALKFSNYRLLGQLSDKVSELISVTPDEPAMDFVARVIKDYNYYTQQ